MLLGFSQVADAQSEIANEKQTNPDYGYVVLDGEILFGFPTGIGTVGPELRAQQATRRIKEIAADRSIDVDEIVLSEPDPNATGIFLNDRSITFVTEGEAQEIGFSRQGIAQERLQIIQEAIIRYRRDREPLRLLKNAGIATLYSLIAAILLWLEDRVFRKLHSSLERLRESGTLSLRLGSGELIPADQVYPLTSQLLRGSRLILTLILLLICLPRVLSLFPWTRQYGAQILSSTQSTILTGLNGFLDYLPDLFLILIILFLSQSAIRLNHFLFRQIGAGHITLHGFYREWAIPTDKLMTVLLIALTVTLLIPLLPGFNSDAFRGVSLFFGFLVSLGSTAVVANVVAGVVLIYSRAFEVGDLIQINQTVGFVVEKTLLVTRLRTIKNVFVTLPNAMVLSGEISNYSIAVKEVKQPLIIDVSITLGYDLPWRKVHKALLKAASLTSGVADNPSPFVLQTALNDFYVSYELNVYLSEGARIPEVKSKLNQMIQDCCVEFGIEIMSPHYLALRDGNEITIPKDPYQS